MPQVRIQPDYPIQARQKGIEGWVDVQFTVGADGSVRDPVVLGAEPKAIFDRAALQAVKGWKYNPKIEDGKPVERADLQGPHPLRSWRADACPLPTLPTRC